MKWYIRGNAFVGLFLTRSGKWTHDYRRRAVFSSPSTADRFAADHLAPGDPLSPYGLFTAHTMGEVDWDHHSEHPRALLLLPWENGTTVAWEDDEDGLFYGCRDVTQSPDHDGVVAAWAEDAAQRSLPVRDLRAPVKEKR